MIGWAAIALWPTNFVSSAVIYADIEELEGEKAAPSSTERSPVAMLKDALLSEDNMAEVRRAIDLGDERARTLHNDIMLRPTAPPVFVAAYDHKDPAIAQQVLQTLFFQFSDRIAKASSSELDELNRKIEDQERRFQIAEAGIVDFRRTNADHLTGADGRTAKLALLQEEFRSLQDQIKSAIVERDSVAEQLAQASPLDVAPSETATTPETLPEDTAEELAALQTELVNLRERYADTHPYVVAVLDAIETLEAGNSDVVPEQAIADAAAVNDQESVFDDEELKRQHEENTAQLSALNNDVAKKRREIDLLQALTNTTSSVEAELSGLEAAKSELEERLGALIAQRDDLGQQDETQTGQASFRLINEPNLPTKPTGPSRLLCLALVLLGGVGLGAAVAVCCNHYKGVFESAWQLRQRFDVGVLGTISEVLTAAERKRLGYSRLMFSLGCLALVSVFSGLVVAESMNLLSPLGDRVRVRLLG